MPGAAPGEAVVVATAVVVVGSSALPPRAAAAAAVHGARPDVLVVPGRDVGGGVVHHQRDRVEDVVEAEVVEPGRLERALRVGEERRPRLGVAEQVEQELEQRHGLGRGHRATSVVGPDRLSGEDES